MDARHTAVGHDAYEAAPARHCRHQLRGQQRRPHDNHFGHFLTGGGGGINITGGTRHLCGKRQEIIDLLMGLFRGAVFRHGWGGRKQPIKQPTDMPTSTMVLMGRFPTLMGRFTNFILRGHFTS